MSTMSELGIKFVQSNALNSGEMITNYYGEYNFFDRSTSEECVAKTEFRHNEVGEDPKIDSSHSARYSAPHSPVATKNSPGCSLYSMFPFTFLQYFIN